MLSTEDLQTLLTRHGYALVDRHALRPELWHGLPLVPLVPKSLLGDADIMPALLDLKSLDAPTTTRLTDNLNAAQAGKQKCLLSGLLAVTPDTTAEQLQKHLESRLETSSPIGYFLLRYYDPRAFVHFAHVLDVPFMRAMYGPISVWTVPFQNEWIELPAPEKGPTRTFWGTNADQRRALDRIGYINMALKKLSKFRGRPWDDLTEYTEAAEKADRALIVATQELKFKISADLIDFAFHSLVYGAHFYRHPRVQQLLDEVQKDKQLGYAGAAVTMVSEQEWAAIAAAN
jgi:hypothetical protein